MVGRGGGGGVVLGGGVDTGALVARVVLAGRVVGAVDAAVVLGVETGAVVGAGVDAATLGGGLEGVGEGEDEQAVTDAAISRRVTAPRRLNCRSAGRSSTAGWRP